MNAVKLLLLGAAGVAGYLAFKNLGAAPVVDVPAGSTVVDTGNGNVVVTTPTGNATASTVELLIQAAGAGPLNADEWNWHYERLRGVPGPDPLAVWPNRDRSYRMTAQEWFDGVRNHGVSGLRRLRPGVGGIMQIQAPAWRMVNQ